MFDVESVPSDRSPSSSTRSSRSTSSDEGDYFGDDPSGKKALRHIRLPRVGGSQRAMSWHTLRPFVLTIFTLTAAVAFFVLTMLHVSSSQLPAARFRGATAPLYTLPSTSRKGKQPHHSSLKPSGAGWQSPHKPSLSGAPAPLSPFSGRFSRFPTMSQLPSRQKRLTLVGVWSSGNFNEYLRQYMHSVQLNADAVDFVLINRLVGRDDSCIDFEANNVNITWGGNVKFVCMSDIEWKHRHVEYLCSKRYGWDCDERQRLEVVVELTRRKDPYNVDWKPLRGHIFRDLFLNPGNPFWAWHDLVSARRGL